MSNEIVGDCAICDKSLSSEEVAAHYAHTDIFFCVACFEKKETNACKEHKS